MPATLSERFFGRMAVIGFPFQIYLDVALDGRIDRAALAVALRHTIADHPRLLVRLTPYRWGLRRRIASADAIDTARLIRRHESVAGLELCRGDALDLADVGPIRLELLEAGGTTRLVIVAHHAMTDAEGLLAIYERLTERYAEACGGAAPPPVPPLADARRRRLLDGATLSTRWAAMRSVLGPFREMIPGLRSVPAARFHDEASADGSVLHTQHLTLPPALVSALVRAEIGRASCRERVFVGV